MLLPQVTEVIIIDNYSDLNIRKTLTNLGSNKSIHVIQLQKNIGLAKALNCGFQYAIRKGYRWALAVDQDTEPEQCMINELITQIKIVPNNKKIAVIGSNFIDKFTQYLKYSPRKGDDRTVIEKKTVITAGSLMSLQVFKSIGPFREDLFIDGIDHEYCLRARSKKFKILMVVRPLMEQPVGMGTRHQFLGLFPVVATNHTPFRWYFLTRNRLINCANYICYEPFWVITRFIRLLGLFGIVLLFEKERKNKFSYIRLGLIDALIGKKNRSIIP